MCRFEVLTFLYELGRRMSVETCAKQPSFFKSLFVATQRFNCVVFKSSLIDGENEPESFLFELLRPMLII